MEFIRLFYKGSIILELFHLCDRLSAPRSSAQWAAFKYLVTKIVNFFYAQKFSL
ncbi:hypothetical protein M5D96_003598 [Drosophila gunungcola]|uniref:Uncharacterized protein n=1 Tax=Drosophila gunungcola TaxID=103775 RepID=A0A9P9YSJ0_9MUSC|nr:hypothetical protein M5D96_003598 [Drosophila gunungcola]